MSSDDKWRSCFTQNGSNLQFEPTQREDPKTNGSIQIWQQISEDYPNVVHQSRIAMINASRHDKGSIHFLAAMIEGIYFIGDVRKRHVSLKLVDSTGELIALLPKELYNKHARHLLPQNAIVLRDSTLLPAPPVARCKHRYLLIAEANLSDIYVRNTSENNTFSRLALTYSSAFARFADRRPEMALKRIDQDGAAATSNKRIRLAAPSDDDANKENVGGGNHDDEAAVRAMLSDVDVTMFLTQDL